MPKLPWSALARALRRITSHDGRAERSRRGAGGPVSTLLSGSSHAYPGDFEGSVEIHYNPHPDGRPDPGEIVWAWVPYEEDHGRGKDRPVLLIGHDDEAPGGPWLLGLQLTSRDHDHDAGQERRAGRLWVDVGSGAWDRRGRPSEARVNRILRLHPQAVRREGAVLTEEVFERVAAAVLAAQPR